MNMIYLDTELNTTKTVRLNIYQSILLVAAKYVAYLTDWKADTIKCYQFCYGMLLD